MPFGTLLPKEYSFFDFFEQHASKCVEGAHLLLQLLQNVKEAEALAKEIKEVEHAGDKITHHTIETLHKTFITPIDREEIHQLISGMDDILDFIDAASQRVVLYEITEITVEAQELGEVLLRATEEVQEAVHGKFAHRTHLLRCSLLRNAIEVEETTDGVGERRDWNRVYQSEGAVLRID